MISSTAAGGQVHLYCGIDLHTRWMYVCILSQTGEIVYHKNHRVGEGSFLKAVASFREGLVVGVECTFTWYWLADLCAREGIEFVLGHALYMRAGMFPMAYVYLRENRATRDPMRRHEGTDLFLELQTIQRVCSVRALPNCDYE